MAQARLLSKKIILSRKLNEVSEGAENLYYRLLVMVDDYGRFHADPLIIKGQIYTLRRTSSEPQIAKRLDELNNIGLVKLYKNNGETYLEILQFEKNQKFRSDIKRKEEFDAPQQGSRIESVTDCVGVDTPRNVDSSQLNRNNNRNNNRNKEGVVERIISHLNEIAGTDFKFSTKSTIGHINARLDEGFSVDDLFRVIEIKVPQWRQDPKMHKYIRPATLFNSEKFEGYLNEKFVPSGDTVGQTPQAEIDRDPISEKLWNAAAKILGDVDEIGTLLQRRERVFEDVRNAKAWAGVVDKTPEALIAFLNENFNEPPKSGTTKCPACGSIVLSGGACGKCGEALWEVRDG